MGADGPVGQVELLADIAVGQAIRDHLGDLEFLGREPVPSPTYVRQARLTCGAQLLPCALSPWNEAQPVESIARGAQWRPGIRDAAAAAKPRPVGELRSGPVERPAGHSRADGSLEQFH